MRSSKTLTWEKKLKAIFDEIDDYLENKYDSLYLLHPNRPPRGSTSNKAHDGLFNVGAAFSAGYGSSLGPGYVVEVRISTLEHVPVDVRSRIFDEVIHLLDQKLPEHFPGKKLTVNRDGEVYKIHGDLSLGEV